MTEPIKDGVSSESGVAPKGISTPHLRSMLNAAIESGDDKQRQLVAELISARFTLAEQREALILHAIFDGHHKDPGPACMANEYTMAIDVIEKLWKSRRMWQDVNDSLADEVLDLGEQLRNLQENYDRVEQQRDDARRRAASADGEATDFCDKYCAEIDENNALRIALDRLACDVVRKQGAISSLVRTLWESRRQLQFLLGAEKANSASLAAMVLGARAAAADPDRYGYRAFADAMEAAKEAERDAHPLLPVTGHEHVGEEIDLDYQEYGPEPDGATTPIGIPEPDPEIGDPARVVAGAALSARPHVILRRDGSLEDATEENLDALQARFRARPGVTNAQLKDGFPRVPEQGFQPELPFEEDGQ